jgi:outer membrane protein assembly factor BamE (lipoprotein component of BamABCDE complex)
MKRLHKFSASFLTTTAACIALASVISACSSRIDQRGNLPDPDVLANIEVGHINKQGVQDLLGTPSSVGLFDVETWYYISEKTETTAFFDPKILDRKVIVIKFDNQGIVSAMNTLTMDDAKQVEMVDRRTPTAGNEYGFFRQLFGNIGRFEAKGKDSGATQ